MNYIEQTRNKTKSGIALTIAVVLHLMLIYALLNGLGHTLIDVIHGPIVTRVIPDVPPPQRAPPPPAPPQIITPPTSFVPPPLLQIQDTPTTTNAITAVTQTAPPSVASFAPVAAPAAPVVADTDVSEQPIGGAAPQYPEQMADDGRAGSAVVQCMVGTSGKTSDCHVIQTKGGEAFGVSALQFAENETYRPATHNGVPIAKLRQWDLQFSAD